MKKVMKLIELNSKSFIALTKMDRQKAGFGHKCIRKGFSFQYHLEFPETGPETFQSKEGKKIDKELFVLETIADYKGSQQEIIELLANFFCGIEMFEKFKNSKTKKDLYSMQFEDLSKYVTDEMLQNQVDQLKELI